MEGVDHTSASKCLDLCQALIGQGQGFNFSLTYTGTSYTFSLDTRSKDIPSPPAGLSRLSVVEASPLDSPALTSVG